MPKPRNGQGDNEKGKMNEGKSSLRDFELSPSVIKKSAGRNSTRGSKNGPEEQEKRKLSGREKIAEICLTYLGYGQVRRGEESGKPGVRLYPKKRKTRDWRARVTPPGQGGKSKGAGGGRMTCS